MQVTGEKHFIAYAVNMTYLICAIICSLSAVVAVVPLYWGGGQVLHSFNPLDVVRVFDAPMLQDASEVNAKVRVREQGQEKLNSVGYEAKRLENTQIS